MQVHRKAARLVLAAAALALATPALAQTSATYRPDEPVRLQIPYGVVARVEPPAGLRIATVIAVGGSEQTGWELIQRGGRLYIYRTELPAPGALAVAAQRIQVELESTPVIGASLPFEYSRAVELRLAAADGPDPFSPSVAYLEATDNERAAAARPTAAPVSLDR